MISRRLILPAAMLVTFVLGSVHAFSIFLAPLETQLGLSRTSISMIYSLALVAITVSVLLGYRIYTLAPTWMLIVLSAIFAAAGLGIAASAQAWWQLCVGFSLMFGLSNGIGYGFCLQLVGRTLPSIKGFAMGAVTASYAVGSICFAQLLAWRIEAVSVTAALEFLALAILGGGLVAAWMLYRARATYGPGDGDRDTAGGRKKIAQFWFAYMTAVFSGLMAIGHAAGIVLAADSSMQLATRGAMMIGAGSAAGGFIAGWLIDRWPVTRFLVGLPMLAATALLLIVVSAEPMSIIALLSVVGFCYGALIAIYPVAISNFFQAAGPRVYGRVFTAWGFAGLVVPWMAGLVYDWHSGYDYALIMAALIALLSAASAALSRLEMSS